MLSELTLLRLRKRGLLRVCLAVAHTRPSHSPTVSQLMLRGPRRVDFGRKGRDSGAAGMWGYCRPGGRGGTDVFHPPRSHVQPRSTSCPHGPRGALRAPGGPAPPSQAAGTPSPPHSPERPHLLSIFFILISQGMKMTMKLQARRANFRQS